MYKYNEKHVNLYNDLVVYERRMNSLNHSIERKKHLNTYDNT